MRPNRTRITIAALALATAVGITMSPGVAQATPDLRPVMTPFTVPTTAATPSQSYTAPADASSPSVSRDSYTVTAPKPKPEPKPKPAPAAVAPATANSSQATVPIASTSAALPSAAAQQAANWATDPGSSESYALQQLPSYGWGQDQFMCLVQLWTQESGWSVSADNGSSGAYGIPQALPGSKMASAGPDWQTNPHTQITWGLGYIKGAYGSPCQAWAHETSAGWY